MSDTDAPKVEAPPLSADVQDPLPESNWLYRRWYIFVLSTINIIGLYILSKKIEDHDNAFWWLLLFLWFIVTYYLVAPSAEQIVKMIQSASMFKSGVSTKTTASVDSASGVATSTTVVGKPTPQAAVAPAQPPQAGAADDELPGYAR